MKVLTNNFYVYGETAEAVIDRKSLKELLLNTGGTALIKGRLYDIVPKHLGAGVYKIKVKMRRREEMR
jgi:hypothetical protein